MRSYFIIFALSFCVFLNFSCSSKKKNKIVFYETDAQEDKDTASQYNDVDSGLDIEYDRTDDIVEVPFTERGGVKFINVTVNGEFTVQMILDSGCSSTLISVAEARYLYDKGCFTENDILGTTQSQIADGSIVNDMVVNLKQLVIGDKIVCNNVKATVSSNTNAPLLLGNEVLDRAPSYSVDNVNKKVIFKLN